MSPQYYEFTYALGEVGMALLPALFSGILASLYRIAAYVLTALAMYTIAKRRCINHPWLAWVPVANVWLLGSLSDQYRYVVKGQIKSKRKVLLMLKVMSICLTISVLAVAVAVCVKGYRGAMYGMRGDQLLEDLVGPLLAVTGLCLPLTGTAIASAVLGYMALYDIYTSCDPDNNVLFTVLSIFFQATRPFFLFFSRNKDLGMPPRRPEPVWQPQHSWENKDYL